MDIYPNYFPVMNIAWEWDITNVNFSIYNLINLMIAKKYIYCLVPYTSCESNNESNNNLKKRKKALEKFKHIYCEFDEASINWMFEFYCQVKYCYWKNKGIKLRKILEELYVNQIAIRSIELFEIAKTDIYITPKSDNEALGIKFIAKPLSTQGRIGSFPVSIGEIK